MKTDKFPPRSLQDLVDWLDHVVGIFAFAELALAAVFVLLALAAPRSGSVAYGWIERRFSGLANHPVRQIIAVGMIAVLARLAVLPWLGTPPALIHDEQSLLLQAQTYMAGHLANATHPFWEHFETFHLNQIPAYASMYFPGRGAPLAAGLLLADNAWAGVWLSFILMSMAAVWMLQGWVSLPLALLGGLLVVVRFGVFSYWINSYWGGAFTALGAMLVLGAMPRILNAPRWRHGVIFGLGAVILMTTRPYEGMLLCIPVAVVLLWRLLRPLPQHGQPIPQHGRLALFKAALPAVLLVSAGGALLLSYNAATTGDPLKTPYSLNRETYAVAPAFLTSPPIQSLNRGPAYFRVFYETEAREHNRRNSVVQTARSVLGKIFYAWSFYLGPTLSIAFLAGLWVARRNWFLIGTLIFFFAGFALETWGYVHYTAPIFPIVLILTMLGFDWLRRRDFRGKPAGLFLTRAMPTAAVALLALPMAFLATGTLLENNSHSKVCCALADDNLRSRLIKQLVASPERDLVLVKDAPHNPIHYEMVYNDAEIDRAEIVWARRLDPDKDRRLMAYFADRRIWEFEWLQDPGQGYALRPLPAIGASAN